MVSFLLKKAPAARAVFACMALLFLAGALFVSCENDPGIPDPDPDIDPINTPPVFSLPGDLKGTWISTFSEIFIISDTTFTAKYGTDVTYAGTIVNHREAGSGAGYITIQYTTATYYSDGVGRFYVIYYKELTSTSVRISGASNSDDPDFSYTATTGGKTTRTEAESTCTVAGGYFDYDSLCTKMGGTSFIHPLAGEWQGTGSGNTTCIFNITDGTISYKTISYNIESPNFTGEIVKVVNTTAVKGYMVFKIIAGTSDSDAHLNKYSLVEWNNYNSGAGTVSLSMPVSSGAWGGIPATQVKETKEEAEAQAGSLTQTLTFTLQP